MASTKLVPRRSRVADNHVTRPSVLTLAFPCGKLRPSHNVSPISPMHTFSAAAMMVSIIAASSVRQFGNTSGFYSNQRQVTTQLDSDRYSDRVFSGALMTTRSSPDYAAAVGYPSLTHRGRQVRSSLQKRTQSAMTTTARRVRSGQAHGKVCAKPLSVHVRTSFHL
jgi:hypothetical protein